MKCPCGQEGLAYKECCEVYISGRRPAPSPVKLMKSRYTAFSLSKLEYIQNTQTFKLETNLNTELNWIKLEILNVFQQGLKDLEAFVEFKAYYSLQSEFGCLHEKSYFIKQGGVWFYVSGEVF